MNRSYHRLLLVFADGVGLGPADEHNPLCGTPTPALESLLGGSLTAERRVSGPELSLAALDATLGIDGIPQSATGQTALFSGINGAQLLGHHVTALPGPRLRAIVEEHSLFRRAAAVGARTTFANAYNDAYLRQLKAGSARPSVTTCAALAGGVRLRTTADLDLAGAVTWDIERDLFGAKTGLDLRPIAARDAGRQLAELAAEHELTVYETFYTDLAGHGRPEAPVGEAVRRLDALLGGIVDAAVPGLTVVLTSDHGSLEDMSTRAHTRNPVPLLAVGPAAPRFASLTSILDVTPALVEILST